MRRTSPSLALLERGDSTYEIVDALNRLGHSQLAAEGRAYALTEADKALRVAVFGEYSVGKSTLINALLGKQILATKLKPTTGVPVEVRHGTDSVKVIFRDGRKQRMSIAEAATYSNLAVVNRARDEVERIVISTEATVLKNNVALIDTPGLLDDDKQTERARGEVAAADVVLLVLRAEHLLSQTERGLALDWLTRDLGKPVVPVVNFLSQVDADGLEELRNILKAFSAHLIRPFDKSWYEVDALPALRYRLGLGEPPKLDDEYRMFSGALEALAADRIREIKAQGRRRWHTSWTQRAQKENAQILATLESEAAHLARTRKAEAERTEAVLDRIRQNRAGERARCVSQVDRHKTGQRLAVAKALPPSKDMKTDQQRKEALERAGRAFERALRIIDETANEILAGLADETGIVLEPISVRELAALDVPPDSDITAAEGGAGLKWAAVLAVGAYFVAVPWVAIPAAILGYIFGASNADTSKEIVAFKTKFCEAIDAQLDKLQQLLGNQFDARADELTASLQARIATIKALPPPAEELKLRRDLAVLLIKAG